MTQETYIRRLFYRVFRFKWRNPFITATKILFRGKCPKRVLGVWDFENGRATIGDAIVFQVILQTIAEENALSTTDVCFINCPAGARNLYQVTAPTAVENIMACCNLNPRIGSVHLFDNNEQFGKFHASFKDDYVIFPNPFVPFAAVTNWHHVTDFFERHGDVPALKSDGRDLQWAKALIAQHCAGRIPVCAALRSNTRDAQRNCPAEEWRRFFKETARAHPEVAFLVIGTQEEIIHELVEDENVVFVKAKVASSLLQDLAIIEASSAFVCHDSGPAIFAYFMKKPTLCFGIRKADIHTGHALKPTETYNFLGNQQKMLWETYTAEKIIREFEDTILPALKADTAI